jgi:hypothetical protein
MQPASVLVQSISGLAKACRSDQHIVGRRSTAHGSQREVNVTIILMNSHGAGLAF